MVNISCGNTPTPHSGDWPSAAGKNSTFCDFCATQRLSSTTFDGCRLELVANVKTCCWFKFLSAAFFKFNMVLYKISSHALAAFH